MMQELQKLGYADEQILDWVAGAVDVDSEAAKLPPEAAPEAGNC
jgi:hypothetical protein